jgi:hypothetical protein
MGLVALQTMTVLLKLVLIRFAYLVLLPLVALFVMELNAHLILIVLLRLVMEEFV